MFCPGHAPAYAPTSVRCPSIGFRATIRKQLPAYRSNPAPSLLARTVYVRAVHHTSPRSLGDALRQSQVDQLSTSIGEEKWAKGVPLVMSLL